MDEEDLAPVGVDVEIEVDLDEDLEDIEEVEDVEDVEDVDLEDDVAVEAAGAVEEEAAEEEVPAARRKARSGEEEDEDEEIDPDDVEADLDTILKDRIASGDDEDEEEEEVGDTTGDPGDRVAAKSADEFVCPTCFLIVHPRQFGRLGKLTCPEGYEPCGAITKVEAQLKKARKSQAS